MLVMAEHGLAGIVHSRTGLVFDLTSLVVDDQVDQPWTGLADHYSQS